MNCQRANLLIDPYADGELEAAAILELEQHLKGCPECGRAWRNLQDLKKALKQDALYFTAPAELRKRVKAELPSPPNTFARQLAWNWKRFAAVLSGMTAVCLALLLMVALNRPSAEQRLAQEVVSGHVRSLMASHTLDVASTDQHTVKPWFNGKVDFSPPVKDLTDHQFPLIGGRLDYIGGRSVAALVFQRQKHIINLFVWPVDGPDSKPLVFPAIQGYHVIHWSAAGMVFWAVSDLNEKELLEFVKDYGAAASLK